MISASFVSIVSMVLLYPAPRDPEPDDKGRGFFGVQLVDNGGVLITQVVPGSPADKAGVRPNDLIQTIDKAQIPTVDEAREVIGRLRPGQVTHVELRRGAAVVSIKVKVGIRPESIP